MLNKSTCTSSIDYKMHRRVKIDENASSDVRSLSVNTANGKLYARNQIIKYSM